MPWVTSAPDENNVRHYVWQWFDGAYSHVQPNQFRCGVLRWSNEYGEGETVTCLLCLADVKTDHPDVYGGRRMNDRCRR